MKIKLVIEDKKKGKVEIPISKRVLTDLYDVFWIVTGNEEVMETIKLNKCDKSFFNFHNKIEHAVFDVIHDGTWYCFKDEKYVPCKKKHYLVKKPNWRK